MRGRLVSTTTVFDRPWLKLCLTVPVLTEEPVRGFSVRGALPGRFSFSSVMRSLDYTLQPVARPKPDSRKIPRPRAGRDLRARPGRGLLAPHSSGRERPEARQPLDIKCPTLGARPARKAVCITFGAPKAKLNSEELNVAKSRG